ncbi:peptidase (plasmid) [Fulvitalea axinellae]|uniref:Peptidase n=1 Tax=Fulvitalea axinellae TaxID=1182444 RepID=A0AAU9CTT0_9BACT|nr:peptidase [Fulvitalea axinellae]
MANKSLGKSIRKWFRIIHRDVGYLIFGFTFIYALSGIALNHIDDWDPSYIHETFDKPYTLKSADISKDEFKKWLSETGLNLKYRKHVRQGDNIKAFVKGGLITVDLEKKTAHFELVRKRPVFKQINDLHYNRPNYWIVFSDLFSGLLLIVSVTGLFIVKGKNGITKRGLYWTLAGIAIPMFFMLWVI